MTFSNDIAMNNSGYERVPLDYYPTPSWITQIICNYIEDNWPDRGKGNGTGMILEPACGEGHMSKVMEEYGYLVDSYDLEDRGFGLGGTNFLTNTWDMDKYAGIVTNPPYGDEAKKFIRHGLELIDGKPTFMAMVLRNEFDCGKSVMPLFRSPLFYGKQVLTKRPHWIEPAEGEKAGSPRHNYSVFYWYGLADQLFGEPTAPALQYAHPSEIRSV